MTQHWKSALASAAVVILSATAGAGTASAHELTGTAKTAASAPADREGSCTAYLSVRPSHRSGYEIMFGGRSHGWSPAGLLRITAVLLVNGHREDSASDTRYGRSVTTSGRTHFDGFVRSAEVFVRAVGPGGSVGCRETRR